MKNNTANFLVNNLELRFLSLRFCWFTPTAIIGVPLGCAQSHIEGFKVNVARIYVVADLQKHVTKC